MNGLVQVDQKRQFGSHTCSLFETDEEQRALLLDFLREGLKRNERLICFIDLHSPEGMLCDLADGGLHVESLLRRGQLHVPCFLETYGHDTFEPSRMLTLFGRSMDKALAEGFSGLRVAFEMTWILRSLRGAHRFIEYESVSNDFLEESPCTALCQYDRRRFSPVLLLYVLSTHPVVAIGTQIHQNLFYGTPPPFLGQEPASETLARCLGEIALPRVPCAA